MKHFTGHEASDADLVSSVARGDRAAFRVLHRRYDLPVYGLALRVVRAPERAEEVANDTMLAVWSGAAGFEGRSKVSTWIFGIAHRTALKALRRKGVERGATAVEAADEAGDEAVRCPETALYHAEVREALAGLPSEFRRVVELTYYHGHSVSETAVLIGVAPGTVKSRMHEARRRLRETLR